MEVDGTLELEVPVEEVERSSRPFLVVLYVVQVVQVSLMDVVVQHQRGAASLLCRLHQVQSAL